jgi:hypothetical protein
VSAGIAQIALKLQRLLLLLSSDQPGEVVAAAAAIKRTLRAAGADFHDLAAKLTSPAEAKQNSFEDIRDWHALRDECLNRRGQLRGRELEFVTNLKTWRGQLTPKQHDWLEAIHARLKRAA